MGYDINNINKYADDLLAKIDACIVERIKNTPQLVSAIVSKVNEDGTVNVYFPPNEKSVFTKIQNQSIYDLQVGDSVEIVLKDGTYSNCWILAKHGVNQAKRVSEGIGGSTNTIIIGGGGSSGEGGGGPQAAHAGTHATGGSDPISPESIGAAQRIISSPNIADLLEWASAQTQSGAFYVDPSVVTANTPEPGVWFNGFIEVGIAGPGRITLSTNNHAAKTYVNCVSSGAWQGWAMQYSDTVRPKPKDIGAAPALKCVHVTLSASGWNSSKAQTVTISGVLADETKQLITPTPAMESQTAYYNAGIRCTGQSANSLTFTAKTIPTANLTVYVTIQEVGA